MYKIAFVVAVILILLAPLAAQRITVVSPNGGETLTLGETFRISWTTSGVSQNVKIVLLRENGDRFGLIADDLAPGGSPYRWPVGETRSGTAPAGRYLVRVVTMEGDTRDVSDGAFAIAAGSSPEPTRPTLRVTSPRSGGVYVEGNPVSVAWDASGLSGDVHIYLKRDSYNDGALVAIRVVPVSDRTLSINAVALGEAAVGVAERADYRFVLICGGVRAESGNFGVTRVPHCDLVISDPYLEQRSGGKGFRVKVTDLGGDFNGWVVISHWCGKMGLGNAVKERRRLELRRGVPAWVNLANVRSTYWDNKCDVNFVFTVNPDRAVVESSYDNNATQKKFCWESGHDGRFFSLRLGRNYTTACEECGVVIRPGDVESVDGEMVRVRLEISVQNCGNTAIRGAAVRTNYSWYFRDAGNHIVEGGTNVDLAEGIDIEPGQYRILFRTVRLRRYVGSTVRIYLECGESGALNGNNNFSFHPNFVGF
jgi:hypothetical protein